MKGTTRSSSAVY